MHVANLHALRLAYEQACDAYTGGQTQLLRMIEGACVGSNDWPTPVDYDAVHALGNARHKPCAVTWIEWVCQEDLLWALSTRCA